MKLIIVRHPFERILSAYRDKLENVNIRAEHGSVHFYNKYGSKIVKKYRNGGNGTKMQDILKPGMYYWDKTKPEPSGVEPTFKEFVRYKLYSLKIIIILINWKKWFSLIFVKICIVIHNFHCFCLLSNKRYFCHAFL